MTVHLPRGGTLAEVRAQAALAKLCTLFVQGLLPKETQPLFWCSRLVALQKRPSGIRPIAVGETFRRLAGKLLLRKHLADVLPSLRPHQVGVGVRGGVETVIHDLRAWVRKARLGEGILSIDFRNAFNEDERATYLLRWQRRPLSFYHMRTFATAPQECSWAKISC